VAAVSPPGGTARRQGGFSLLELVIVMVVTAIGAVALLSLFSGAALTLESNLALQTGAQLAQEKAEQVLADRRNPARGYGYVQGANYPPEDPVPGFPGYARSVTVTPYSGAACPAGADCRQVVVSVDQGGVLRGQITFLVAGG